MQVQNRKDMAKVEIYESNGWKQCWFYCEGCKCTHAFTVGHPEIEKSPLWTWNNNIEKPTFSPSLLVNGSFPESRCHSFVNDGKIQYLGDCFHELKNKTIELTEIE